MLQNQIHFTKAHLSHSSIIFQWLSEPHIVEFWDNSPEHKDDILNFLHGKKQHYFYGTIHYWVGSINNDPFAFILSDVFQKTQTDLSSLHRQHLSMSGHTIGLDFCIGNTKYLGFGLAAPTLEAFVNFYHNQVDPLADTFFIDPDEHNLRAKHVYTKAGFQLVGEFTPQIGAFTKN